MSRTWSGVTVDCHDPERLARFWGTLLGREASESGPDRVCLGERGEPLPRLVFQRVPEPKQGKVRLHLDVTVDSVETGIATVVALGGTATGERHEHDDGVVVVMTDPEGNEFCLAEHYG